MAWYFARDGRKTGPLEWDELLIAAAKGELSAEDVIWSPNLRAWVRAADMLKFLGPGPRADKRQDKESDGGALERKSGVKANRAGTIFEAPSSPSQIPPGPIAAHWRGDVSLVRAYWINGFLVSLIAVGVIAGLRHYVETHELTPKQGAAFVIALYALILSISVWQWVGIWRSANWHPKRGGKRSWAYLAKACVTLGILLTAAELARTGSPLLIGSLKTLAGHTDIPEMQFRILGEGTELEIAGGLRSGSAEKLEQHLDGGPAIKVIHLNSSGGLVSEGLRIHRLIKERNLTTYTATECVSACAIAFLAGAERFLGANGRIGFHSASINGVGEDVFAEINRDVRQVLLDRGAPQAFVDKAMHTEPGSIWYPETRELIDAKIVTAIADSKKFAQSGVKNRLTLEEAENALSGIPVYRALKAHDPQMYRKIRDTLIAKMNSGASLQQITAQIRSVITDYVIPKYLVTAPDKRLLRYWRSQIAEMRALHDRDPNLCVDFLFPHFAKEPLHLRRLLPQRLIDEDFAALSEVIEQTAISPQNAEPRPQIKEDLSTVMSSLSEKYPNLIDIIGAPEKHRNKPGQLCQSFILLYEGILSLGDAKRSGPLLRYLVAD